MKPRHARRASSPLVLTFVLWVCCVGAFLVRSQSPGFELERLSELQHGPVAMQNALWIENPLSARFNTSNRVVVADLKGPATLVMIHFAMPQVLKLNRDLLLRMYWDGEDSPSVDCPLVDFFCDPAGLRDEINTVLVNKRRGFNAYFPMPFRASARVELVYDGPLAPGEKLWQIMPCYSYVMYRKLEQVGADTGYFHASWRQEGILLGQRDYLVMETRGRGKFVGWNVTVRRPGRTDYPVDENEKFYVDGETIPSIEFQGLEDSFGFSWGYPESQSIFPLTGYFPYFKGGAAYRFFIHDAIPFEKSLRVMIGFGSNEDKFFSAHYAKPGNELELSSVAYWYQVEPHKPFPPISPAVERTAAPEDRFWPGKENLASPDELRGRGVRLQVLCGRPTNEVVFAENGFGAAVKAGYAYDNWMPPVYYCRAGEKEVRIELLVPRGSTGTVRLFVVDPDRFEGGRKQTVAVAGKVLGEVLDFQRGRWLEQRVDAADTAAGKVLVEARNSRLGANAVISILEWVQGHP